MRKVSRKESTRDNLKRHWDDEFMTTKRVPGVKRYLKDIIQHCAELMKGTISAWFEMKQLLRLI